LASEQAAADMSNWRIRLELSGVALELRRSAQRSAIELGVERLEAAIGGKWKTRPRIVLRGKSERRTETILARLRDRAQESIAGIIDLLSTVRHEKSGVDRLWNREAKLKLASGSDDSPEVGNGIARAGVIGGKAARNARLADVRIAIGRIEVAQVAAELPLHLRPLAASEKIRLIETDKPAETRPLTHGRAEVDVAR